MMRLDPPANHYSRYSENKKCQELREAGMRCANLFEPGNRPDDLGVDSKLRDIKGNKVPFLKNVLR